MSAADDVDRAAVALNAVLSDLVPLLPRVRHAVLAAAVDADRRARWCETVERERLWRRAYCAEMAEHARTAAELIAAERPPDVTGTDPSQAMGQMSSLLAAVLAWLEAQAAT